LSLSPKPHRLYFLAIGAVAAAAAFVPIPYLASPQWEVLVVDGSGKPIENMTVRSVYQNYSTENAGHEEDQQTDKSGYASFPAHWSSSSAARRGVFTLLLAMAGVHASFGQHAYVFAFGKGMEGSAVSGQYVMDWAGTPAEIKTRIIAKRLPDLRRQ
jgi:hypothetical protein